MEERIREILLAKSKSEVSTSDIVTGFWSSTVVDEKIQAILTAVAESLPEKKSGHEFEELFDMENPYTLGWNAYRNEVLAQLGKEDDNA